ncbi:anhydro-N-acetylmuramic acid kinase [Winogradskyella sp. A3E31]|uniref:anhydro-N-acetylmuramic acid kinase n=1 Tax=Winogradskyella sp. A3E31 TaxID=3349637 RepID=UPI00398A6130
MSKSKYQVIGVMSGTSLDGIDIIFAEFEYNGSWSYIIKEAETKPYTDYWRSLLSNLTSKSSSKLQQIDEDYSIYLGSVIKEFIDENKIKSLDFVTSHGHTALHQPEKNLTYQIGNLQVLSDILGVKVICDFRKADVELGGQGAPLVPIGDQLLFSDYEFCLNLGGFANISYNTKTDRIAYDICPVNIVLNRLVSELEVEYDKGGRIAKRGSIDESLLSELNALNYYSLEPPKSLGLEWVEEHVFSVLKNYNLAIEDKLRTFVEHIALQISKVISTEHKKVLVTGGGAYNDFLISRITHHSKSEICIPDSSLVEFKEALIFAFLGILKDRNETNCLSSVTGALKDHSSGNILMPKIII